MRGPIFLVCGLLCAAFIAFALENWPSSATGTTGFDFDLLSNLVAFILSIHTATTSAVVAWLFKIESTVG